MKSGKNSPSDPRLQGIQESFSTAKSADISRNDNAKIPISRENRATFICPNCGWSKAINVSRYLEVEQEIRLKIHCRCRHTYYVVLDRRKFYRKETDLYGNFMCVHFPGSFLQERTGAVGEMTVTNLSEGGLRFRPSRKTILDPGDQVRVEFHLDDLNRSRILKQAVVKSITESYVGVEYIFVDYSDLSDRALSYYLHFNR